jgi:monoamine oxidase
MSRSLFARLHRQFGPKIDAATRRDFLKATLLASAGLLISRNPLFADDSVKKNGIRVAVIGAGFAGLSCAYELMMAGYDVRVIEARERVSGRVLSFSDFVPGKNVEGGGELIGSNHPHWVAYKEKFSLEFLDVADCPEGTDQPLMLGGKMLDAKEAKELYEQMEAAMNKMNDDARPINEDEPWNSPNALALDKKTTREWVESLNLEPLCKLGVVAELEGNNGVALELQSYLGNLTQVKGGGVERYWTDSEVYRCKGGNMQLALKLAEKIGDRLHLGNPVSQIDGQNDRMSVTCRDHSTFEVDDVVLAIPPSTWKNIRFNPDIPSMISPQMGDNLKYLAALKSRFWTAKKLCPDSQSDTFISMTWEGTDGQEGDANACLNCFSGGPSSKKARAIPKDQRDKTYAEMLEKFYPGFTEAFVKSRFMAWPEEEFTGAGYSFPAPGQVTTVGPLLAKGMGRLHFAGEHACYKFVGYMEGALSSGAALAKRIAQRDGILIVDPPTTAPTTMPAPALIK